MSVKRALPRILIGALLMAGSAHLAAAQPHGGGRMGGPPAQHFSAPAPPSAPALPYVRPAPQLQPRSFVAPHRSFNLPMPHRNFSTPGADRPVRNDNAWRNGRWDRHDGDRDGDHDRDFDRFRHHRFFFRNNVIVVNPFVCGPSYGYPYGGVYPGYVSPGYVCPDYSSAGSAYAPFYWERPASGNVTGLTATVPVTGYLQPTLGASSCLLWPVGEGRNACFGLVPAPPCGALMPPLVFDFSLLDPSVFDAAN